MDLAKEIAKTQSKMQKDKIVSFIGNDKKRFADLVSVFLNGPHRITQRAAWPLTYAVERHPKLIHPHLKDIIRFVKKADCHDAVKRNTIRLLQFIDIPNRHTSSVADLCFGYLSDRKEPVAIRVFSMTVLANIAFEHPDLKRELIVLIEDEMPYASAAFISRGKKVLKQLHGL